MKSRRKLTRSHNKGIYILPNLFTSCSLFGGVYAIIAATQGRYEAGAIAILISSILDGMDGKIARYTNTTSYFGAEFDSLSDLVAFGVAPGLLLFEWSLNSFGRLGWLAIFLYIVCGALRLARFNIQKRDEESHNFRGLPIPAAAIFLSSLVLFVRLIGGLNESIHVFIICSFYALSFLMVSTVNYFSFKELDLLKRKPFNVLVAAILLFIVIAYKPSLMLFVISVIYVVSGPVRALYLLTHKDLSERKREEGLQKE